MLEGLLIDGARFGHFVGFALGIGAGCFADFSLIRKLRHKITPCDIENLELIHRIVWTGLCLLWVSGVALIYARTGFVWNEFTSKLVMKLIVVAILTLNALMLGVIAMPILHKSINRAFIAFSLEKKIVLSTLAAISAASWVSGLVLGIFSFFRPANFEFLILVFGFAYLVAIAGALLIAVIIHIGWERKKDRHVRELMNDPFWLEKFRRSLELPVNSHRSDMLSFETSIKRFT